jgi:hypothetical protein
MSWDVENQFFPSACCITLVMVQSGEPRSYPGLHIAWWNLLDQFGNESKLSLKFPNLASFWSAVNILGTHLADSLLMPKMIVKADWIEP